MNIAIIGTGISGMVAAHLLQGDHELTIYEVDSRIGGHTHTVSVSEDKTTQSVDTGFIVFNELTYPNFVKLINKLGVSYQKSSMSFSVKCERSGLEYNGTSLNTLFAQRKNLFSWSFHKMIREILRFNKEAKAFVNDDAPSIDLGTFLKNGRYSENFIEHYLYPMTAAIWSANPQKLSTFPFKFLAGFFENHRMLDVNNRPDWQVIKGGSKMYMDKLTAPFKDRIQLNDGVQMVKRVPKGVQITTSSGTQTFDHVIIAAHSDQALKMLDTPTDLERDILSHFPYQHNEAILHTDNSIMPHNKLAWASWNYLLSKKPQSQACVSYYMNELQSLDSSTDYFVSLNSSDHIDPKKIIRTISYEHPIFTFGSYEAQKRHSEISGVDGIHYCGAYWGYGFHEDGVKSGLKVAKYFGKSL